MSKANDLELNEVELVLDAHATLAEGPLWDSRTGALVWVDIERFLVHVFDPSAGRDETIDVGQHVGAVVPHEDGGFVLAIRDGFAALRSPGQGIEMIAEVEADVPGNRMNDGKCDSVGRFWAGTLAFDFRDGAGALYRLGPDRSVTRVLERVTISNGLGWSSDDRLMYFIDSPTQRIDVLDYDIGTGEASGRRRFVTIAPELGTPDGMTVDVEGFLWVALWGGSAVHRYSPEGTLERIVRLPTAHVSSCTFGGADLDELYITSARFMLSKDDLLGQPNAGGIFRCRPGVKGTPSSSYRERRS